MKSNLKAFVCLGLLSLFAGCADSGVETSSSAPAPEEVVEDAAPAEETHAGPFYVTVDNNNFEQVVLQSDKPVLIDFWAPWCGPCRQIAPSVEELAQEYDGKAVVAKINVDDAPELAARYDVSGIPNLIFVLHGEQVDEILGLSPKEDIEAKLVALIPDAETVQ